MKLHQFIKPLILTLCIALSNYLNAQYTGGEASGTALGITIQSVCSPLVYPDIYKGGEQDGFDAVAVVQANCSPLVMPAIFTGGNDDGHAMLELNQVNCSPVIYPNIFAGGIEDGYATSGLTQASCQPHIYPAIFAGGVEDGYAAFNLNQTNCNPDPLPDIYSGGIEDGHAMVAMFTACAPFADFTADFTVVCEGDTVNFTDLSLGIPTSWSWTFNGGNPANSSQQNPSVVYDTPGTYSVTLFITSGTGNSTITKTDYIIVNAVPVPLISASGPTSFCEGDSVLISCAPAFNLYNWSNGANTQNTFAFASGTYSVTVTSANGCSGVSNPIDITVLGNPKPVIFTNGPTPVCAGDTVMLTSSPANSYNWSPGGQSSQNIAVTSSGTFWVSATYANGCSRISDPVSVSFGITPAKPVITPSGPLNFCDGGSVTLQSSPAPGYLWSPGGQTSQSVIISNSGTYYVEAVGASGCTNVSDPVTVTVLPQTPVPTISANGPTTFCDGGSVELTSSAATSYLWSPGGQTTQSIIVTTSGTYTLQADNGTGCTAESLPITVTVNAQTPVPTISANGPTTFCDGGSVELTSSAATSYLWSPGGQTTQSIIVTTSGTYTVQADNGTGCTAESLPITVTVNAQTPVPTISANGPTTFCDGGSVELTSSAATSYLWSPGGQTTQSIIVTTSGTYTVQADNGTGCTAESLPITVTVNAQTPVPTISANGPTTFCDGGSVELTSSAATSYLWSPGGQTTQSIIVNTSGTYTVQADNGTGCTAESLPINVTVNSVPAVPVITASGPLTFCDGDSVVLTSSVSGSYLWHPSGAVTQSITVNSAGTHYVEVFNGSCSSVSLPVTVSILPNPGVPTITPNGLTELCAGDSVLLSSSPATSYLWYPGSETTQNIWVSSSGTYWVEVFNPSGCSSISQEISVTVHPNPVVTIVGDLIVCEGTTETYTVSNQPGLDYFWTVNGATITGGIGTHSIDVMFDDEGNIQIEVTVVDQVTGCSASEMISVSSLSAPVAYAGPDLSICYGDTVQLQAYGGTTYLWIPSFGLSNPNIADPLAFPTVTTQYIVEVANGSCTDRDTMLLTVNPLPIADAGSDAYIMLGECATLSGSGGLYYFWSPGTGLSSQTTATPQACPEETTNYVLLVTDLNGCTSTDEMTVFVTQYTGEISFPNTFTPNGDGINDKWEIDGLEAYPDHNLIIFNRWGNKVYDAQPYLNDWEGDCIGKPLPDGTYYFVFDPGDGSEPVKSYLTIIR